MTKYLLSRLLRGLLSVVVVIAIVMLLVYTALDRNKVFVGDSEYTHKLRNSKVVYELQKWEDFGYVDYVPYAEYLESLLRYGEIDQATYDEAVKFGNTASEDTPIVTEYINKFTKYYKDQGYEVKRLDTIYKSGTTTVQTGGQARLYAYRDMSLPVRLWTYLKNLIRVDNVHYVDDDIDIGERKLTFTLFDPAYGGDKFAPAIMGNGTQHKYLLYFDSQFPFIHQNLVKVKLGTSYNIQKGIDVFDMMTTTQGSFKKSTVTYPSGNVAYTADNIHSATYSRGSLNSGNPVILENYVDDYTSVSTYKNGMSKMGYSFLIGIISVVAAYLLAVPLGIMMARKKDGLLDKLGTIYIIFIIAVPSLAYIFLFRSIGGKFGLPITFNMDSFHWTMYVLPIISLALPSIAGLMKWLRRYMIDQMNSDYVKFARAGGLSEGEILRKHILKNAIIPIVHGIPASVLGALVGAIITERIYVVPGTGDLLTRAINASDNGVIVGITFFYALLSVISIILGDICISLVDPRISFTSKKR